MSRCDGSAHRPSPTGVRPITSDSANPETARNLSFTRRMLLSPRRTTAIGSGLERMAPAKSSCVSCRRVRAERSDSCTSTVAAMSASEAANCCSSAVHSHRSPTDSRHTTPFASPSCQMPASSIETMPCRGRYSAAYSRVRGSAAASVARSVRFQRRAWKYDGNRRASSTSPHSCRAPSRTKRSTWRRLSRSSESIQIEARATSRVRPAASVIARHAVAAPAVGTPLFSSAKSAACWACARNPAASRVRSMHCSPGGRGRRRTPSGPRRPPPARQSPARCSRSLPERCAAQRSNSPAAIGTPT